MGRGVTSFAAGQPAGASGDVACVDAGPREQLRAGPGAWHLADREVRDGQVALPGGKQGIGDRRAEPAFGMVVFGDHDPPAGGLRRRDDRGGVDGLDAVAVDDAGVDAFGVKDVRGAGIRAG
jgi:hypothetical protein